MKYEWKSEKRAKTRADPIKKTANINNGIWIMIIEMSMKDEISRGSGDETCFRILWRNELQLLTIKFWSRT